MDDSISNLARLMSALPVERQLQVLRLLDPASAVPEQQPTPEPTTPPARLSDADFLRDLSSIAAGRRSPVEAARQRGVVPGGAATPPGAIDRHDPAQFLQHLSSIAAGKTQVG
jgi:hypothetical protein